MASVDHDPATVADSVAKLTEEEVTPGTDCKVFSTRPTQEAQFIFETSNVIRGASMINSPSDISQ
jgi:hypothetical protein